MGLVKVLLVAGDNCVEDDRGGHPDETDDVFGYARLEGGIVAEAEYGVEPGGGPNGPVLNGGITEELGADCADDLDKLLILLQKKGIFS